MIMIILAYLALCFSVCFFKKVIPFVLALFFGISWYLVFYGHRPATGLLLFLVFCLSVTLYRVASNGALPATHAKTGRMRRHEDLSSGRVWYLIPVFWPLLIARAVLGDKVHKTDMSPYDYEQHLKTNAK